MEMLSFHLNTPNGFVFLQEKRTMQLSREEILIRASKVCKNTLMETLDIEITDFSEDYVIAKMPVTPKVHQPDGVLHGGATVALAETTGSFAAEILMNLDNIFVRGIEISANHLKSVRNGYVYAKASYLHKGRTTQLLEIRVTDDFDNLISICKLTTIALPKSK